MMVCRIRDEESTLVKFYTGEQSAFVILKVAQTVILNFLIPFSYFDTNESVYKTKKYLGSEECVVDNVKLCGTFNTDSKKVVCLTLRVPVSFSQNISRLKLKNKCPMLCRIKIIDSYLPDANFN